jgi:hypothetical protein
LFKNEMQRTRHRGDGSSLLIWIPAFAQDRETCRTDLPLLVCPAFRPAKRLSETKRPEQSPGFSESGRGNEVALQGACRTRGA